MKVNDTAKVTDGSYSMKLIKGKMECTIGCELQSRLFRVHDVNGAYPTDSTYGRAGINNALLVDVADPDFVLFTQERFCRVVAPVSKKLPPRHLEIVIPYGTKQVNLVLQ